MVSNCKKLEYANYENFEQYAIFGKFQELKTVCREGNGKE